MTSEQWPRIEGLYLEALRIPTAERARFVNDACAGDEALKGEVESLLAQDSCEFFETPAIHAAAKLMTSQHESLIGTDIGPYHVLSLLGVGGMGEVYRATDTRLERCTAVGHPHGCVFVRRGAL